MMKKCIGMLVCMLLVAPILIPIGLADPGPQLEIEIIQENRGIAVLIKNIGDEDAINVTWEVNITVRGMLFFGNLLDHYNGTIDVLPAGNQSIIQLTSGIFLGFGMIEIEAFADADNADPVSAYYKGLIFIFYLFPIP